MTVAQQFYQETLEGHPGFLAGKFDLEFHHNISVMVFKHWFDYFSPSQFPTLFPLDWFMVSIDVDSKGLRVAM